MKPTIAILAVLLLLYLSRRKQPEMLPNFPPDEVWLDGDIYPWKLLYER